FTECCLEHLWFTRTRAEMNRGRYARGPRPTRARIPTGVLGPFSVKSLAEIADTLDQDHEVPIVDPVQYEPCGELPLDPYFLGLLLGDGGLTRRQPCFHKPEKDLQRRFTELLPEGDRCKPLEGGVGLRVNGGGLLAILMDLGLQGCRSFEKFIPEPY